MSPEDYLIWQRWWPTKKHLARSVYWDVYLGEGIQLDDEPANYQRMWQRNTQKRADAVIETADSIWLVEMRFQANSIAVGRLLMYQRLWRQDPALPGSLRLWLVTDTRDSIVEALCQELSISYEVA
jgi:hypothetical protein